MLFICRTFHFIHLVSLQQVSNTWKQQNKANFIRVKMGIIYTIENFGQICKEILDFAAMAQRILYIPRFSFFKAGVPLIGPVSPHNRRQASAKAARANFHCIVFELNTEILMRSHELLQRLQLQSAA